jgi:phage N-6-adenine-methyltransferase
MSDEKKDIPWPFAEEEAAAEAVKNAVINESTLGLIDNSDASPYKLRGEYDGSSKKQISQFLTSNDQTWMTPPEFMASLAGEFHFVLDIAASAKSAQAPVFFTEADNAFTKDWAKELAKATVQDVANRRSRVPAIFCNPPYSDKRYPLADWIFRAWYFRRWATSVWLLPANKTDQVWHHRLVIPYAEVRDVEGRINFLDPETGKSRGANSQASKLVVFGPGYGPGPLISHRWKKEKKSSAKSVDLN